MRKRERAEINGNELVDDVQQQLVDRSELSCRRFSAYIHAWREDVSSPRATLPSSLPALTPLPMIAAPLPFPRSDVAADATRGTHGAMGAAEDAVDATAAVGTGIVYDDLMLKHVSNDKGDFERPARLEKTLDHLDAVGLLQHCTRLRSKLAKTKDLRRVHSREHVDYVDQLDFFMSLKSDPSASVGQDLYACDHTSQAARCAAGCVTEAARAVATGGVRNAMALVRPPGHHAGPDNPSGFCFYNNVAVAARAVQNDMHSEKGERPNMVIFDWDVHHCDGTEGIFYDDPSVLVISVHQYRNGRGHVLRKKPTCLAASSLAKDPDTAEISMEALEALLPSSSEPNGKTGNSSNNNNNGGINNAEEDAAATTAAATAEPTRAGRRATVAIDYLKLAAELDIDDDGAAALFGVAAEASSGSSSSSSSMSSSGGEGSNADGGAQRRYAGDTDGLSFDDNSEALPGIVGRHHELQDDDDDDEEGEEGNCDGHQQREEELFYPGTGHLERIGGEAARGRNVNIPWPVHGMGDAEYLHILTELVIPLSLEHQPAVFFISCGFDSARGDLLGSMNVTASGYYLMTKLLCRHFPSLVVALEGGYHVANVARCSEAVLRALLEESRVPVELPSSRMLWCRTTRVVDKVKDQLKPFWKTL